MGNGTTAVVAKANFRHYIGFELNKSMKDVINANIDSVKVGRNYIPYSQREDQLVEKARRKYTSKGPANSTRGRLERKIDLNYFKNTP